MENDYKKYKCPVCKRETMYSDLCDRCYQVENSIDHYLSTKEGMKRITTKIIEKFKELI